MKVINLIVERKPSYDDDYPSQMVGTVQLQGMHGKIESRLASKTLASIFALIREDVQKTADYNARQVGDAIDEASGEAALIDETAMKIEG